MSSRKPSGEQEITISDLATKVIELVFYCSASNEIKTINGNHKCSVCVCCKREL